LSPGEEDSLIIIERSSLTMDLKIVSPRRGPSLSESVRVLNSVVASLYMATNPRIFSLA